MGFKNFVKSFLYETSISTPLLSDFTWLDSHNQLESVSTLQ